jgi:hypothetical protein
MKHTGQGICGRTACATTPTTTIVKSTSPTESIRIGLSQRRKSVHDASKASAYRSGGRNRNRIRSGSSGSRGSQGIEATPAPSIARITGAARAHAFETRCPTAITASSTIRVVTSCTRQSQSQAGAECNLFLSLPGSVRESWLPAMLRCVGRSSFPHATPPARVHRVP